MKLILNGNRGYEIKFEDHDTEAEKRIIAQGISFIMQLLVRFLEIKEK